ncbi:hypothetical protein [Bosea sp. PAMC 26642]|uniref:hypothetical protein n=1 Tax=Bosea sp. (strain PAMC 26642) TaxID=1792307 RepID=UPI00076FEA58|nr:hypothetical protein [Bosea sp. PAMC 26642]AMJ60196.1 hypothetical protein AXW83_07710 [Bosea sp. PAMC 26642]
MKAAMRPWLWSGLGVMVQGAAQAATLTMSCAYVDGTPTNGTRDVFINQIVVNTDRPMITLRVAQTIGTNAPMEWVFDTVNGNALSVIDQPDGSFSASGVRSGSVTAFVYAKQSGVMIWSYSSRFGGEAYRFTCRP